MHKLAHARKHHAGKKREKALAKESQKVRYKFGELEFDHIRVCKHRLPANEAEDGLNENNQPPCSFCRMIELQTRKILHEEKVKQDLARAESIRKRGEMRYKLLMAWSKNQALFYQDLLSYAPHAFTVDICLSSATVRSLEGYLTLLDEEKELLRKAGLNGQLDKVEKRHPIDQANINKILHRRRRIMEIGDYASTFIQARIRKMIARRKVRRYLMKRFELILSDNEAFTRNLIVDDIKGPVDKFPSIIEDVVMRTPRTMARRLQSYERKGEDRLRRFNRYMESFKEDRAYGDDEEVLVDFYEKEQRSMQYLLNIMTLRDVIELAMFTMEDGGKFIDKSNKAKRKQSISQRGRKGSVMGGAGRKNSVMGGRKGSVMGGRKGSVMGGGGRKQSISPSRRMSKVGEDASNNEIPGSSDEKEKGEERKEVEEPGRVYTPFWFTFAAPAPTNRELAISIAIGTRTFVAPVLPTKRVMSRAPDIGGGGGRRGKKQDAEEEEAYATKQMNATLQALDRQLWECLRCDSPEDVIEKLLIEDLHPPLMSCVHIAEDTENIWRARTRTRHGLNVEEHLPGVNAKTPPEMIEEMRHSEDAEGPGSVLPMSLQLRPFPINSRPKNVFRLFFLEEELVAVTPWSTCTYYGDVNEKKGMYKDIIKDLALDQKFSDFMHNYLVKANAFNIEKLYEAGFDLSGPKRTLNRLREAKNAQVDNPPLYCPQANLLYKEESVYEERPSGGLLPERVVDLADKWRFLKKVSKFKHQVVKAQTSVMRFKKKGNKAKERHFEEVSKYRPTVAFDSFTESRKNYVDQARKNVHLRGNDLYELWNQDVDLTDVTETRARGEEIPLMERDFRYQTRLFDAALNVDTQISNRVQLPVHVQKLKEEMEQQARIDKINKMREAAEKELADKEAAEKAAVDEESVESTQSKKKDDKRSPSKGKGRGSPGKRSGKESKKEKEAAAKANEDEALVASVQSAEKENVDEEKLRSLKTLMEPIMDLFVVEIIFPTDTASEKATKQGSGSDTDEDSDEEDYNTALVKPVPQIFQVVGVFPVDRDLNPREPPNVDTGMIDWEYLLQLKEQQEMKDERKHPLTWLASPPIGNYFGTLDKTNREWSSPDDNSGLSIHDLPLRSGKRFRMGVMGGMASQEHVFEELPRHVRRWVGLVG